MWLFAPAGFYSVVQKVGDQHLTVRARDAADLDRLREQYLPTLSATLATPRNDYPFRAMATRRDFAAALGRIASDIKYDNFKDHVASRLGERRSAIYSEVWLTMHLLESEMPGHRNGRQSAVDNDNNDLF